MKKEITITYEWWPDDSDIETPSKHYEALEENAQKRIFQQIQKSNFTSGQLSTMVRFGKDIVETEDKDDGISYSGWWSSTIKTI